MGRLTAAWGRRDLRGRLQTDLCPRPQRHPRDARGGTAEEL